MAAPASLKQSDDKVSSKADSPETLDLETLVVNLEGRGGLKDFLDKKNYVVGDSDEVISPQDWYKVFPYQLIIVEGLGPTASPYIYSLPIPPDSLNYSLVSASNVTATLGGVVEETTENVFWQVSLSGTMGIAPSRSDTDLQPNPEDGFRQSYNAGGILGRVVNSVLGGLSSVTQRLDAAGGAISQASNVFKSSTGGDTTPAFDKLAGALENQPWFTRSAVNGLTKGSNGYTEIHKLHLFLNLYAKLKDDFPNTYKLYFVSQKDNIRWQVILKGFSIQKSVNQPMLYRYNMQFQGFNMERATSNGGTRTPVDRFGPKGDLATANSLTATGAISKAGGLAKSLKSFGTSGGRSAIKLPGVI